MDSARLSQNTLGRAAGRHLVLALAVVSAMLFVSAGTFRYWEAWVYLAALFAMSLLTVRDLLKNSPALLERRMRLREKEPRQRWIMGLAGFWFVVTFLVPGFDQRVGGSEVPVLAVMAADLFVVLGYGLVFWVFRENPYASRIVEVEPEQKVVATGPYAVVRHPMYLGALVMYLFTPLALGSYWAIIPAAFIIPILVARILNEESTLAGNLDGYREYLRSTRYRLVPGVW